MNQIKQKYPRFGDTASLPKLTKSKKCAACADDATHKVTVQVSWFRGDDEVLFACDQHRKGDGKKALLATLPRPSYGRACEMRAADDYP